MEAEILSPFQEGSKAERTTREFRLWHKHQWVLGRYYVYQCVTTGKEFRTPELSEINKTIAEEILKDKCRQ